MTEFGVFDLFRVDSFTGHFNFARFPFPRGRSVHDHGFSGKDREHHDPFSTIKEEHSR